VTGGIVTPEVLEWAGRVRPGAVVTDCTVRPLAGGNVARQAERLTLHLTDGGEPLELVRKDAPGLEIAGLRAAQAVRREGSAIPELVACGDDWLITPLAPGSALDWGDAVPENLFGTLAGLHARYLGEAGLPGVIPRVTSAWFHGLCLIWVEPRLREHAARHPAATMRRARALLRRAARLPAVATVLAELPATLVHGDVHPGNVLVHADQATLIDWGSSRVGPAALDLANLVAADSPSVARYASAWEQAAGQPLPAIVIELGYRWAALQIPVQYLPWMTGHRSTGDVEAALDRIEHALDRLAA
jgi:hypothetical protein